MRNKMIVRVFSKSSTLVIHEPVCLTRGCSLIKETENRRHWLSKNFNFT